MYRKAKITPGKNNPVYSIYLCMHEQKQWNVVTVALVYKPREFFCLDIDFF